jgi:hypothetical protein
VPVDSTPSPDAGRRVAEACENCSRAQESGPPPSKGCVNFTSNIFYGGQHVGAHHQLSLPLARPQHPSFGRAFFAAAC